MKLNNICIVGAGIAGCTIARCLADHGHSITIFEKQSFVGGNCYDFYDQYGVLIHKFGPHIFHTNYENVWVFVNRFSKFNDYMNRVLVEIDSKNIMVPFPINLISIKKLFPDKYNVFYNEIKSNGLLGTSIAISELLDKTNSDETKQILEFIFKNIYANYTAKMWGVDIKDVDPNVIKRVKVNLNDAWNYFPDDKHCGLPIDGYSVMLQNMLDHPNIKTFLNTEPTIDLENDKVMVDNQIYDKIIYTGSLDKLLDYKYGDLPYRSIELKFEHHNVKYFQDAPIINYPADPELTRICEYKYLTKQDIDTTTISYEYPGQYNRQAQKWNVPFYPINNTKNIEQYNQYLNDLNKYKNLVVCGRLADYKYYDMDDIIFRCLEISNTMFDKN